VRLNNWEYLPGPHVMEHVIGRIYRLKGGGLPRSNPYTSRWSRIFGRFYLQRHIGIGVVECLALQCEEHLRATLHRDTIIEQLRKQIADGTKE
jgi:hypothetical protein